MLVFLLLGCSDSKQSESANTIRQLAADKAKEETPKGKSIVKRLEFHIDIDADKEKIWKALWEDKHYRDWSGVFGEGSHYRADNWNEGSQIMFLASDLSGIYSIIEKHIPNRSIQFKHIGSVVNGKEQAQEDVSEKWSGATESYTLKEGIGFTTLLIEIDVLDEHVEFMTTKLPIALEKIKENSR